jgi:hypothetical protein
VPSGIGLQAVSSPDAPKSARTNKVLVFLNVKHPNLKKPRVAEAAPGIPIVYRPHSHINVAGPVDEPVLRDGGKVASKKAAPVFCSNLSYHSFLIRLHV